MAKSTSRPLSARLSWEEVHRLEVLMRTRAVAMTRRGGHDSTCAVCGAPLDGDGMRVAGVSMHPGCLPGGPGN
jgi:hypothetical protein